MHSRGGPPPEYEQGCRSAAARYPGHGPSRMHEWILAQTFQYQLPTRAESEQQQPGSRGRIGESREERCIILLTVVQPPREP